jgi:hypothetical protein
MFCPSHPPWLDHSNYTWRRVQVMKLLFGPNILLNTLLSNTLSLRSPPNVKRPSFTPIQNHRQNYSFVYSNFYVFRQHAKRTKGSGPNGSKHYRSSVSS